MSRYRSLSFDLKIIALTMLKAVRREDVGGVPETATDHERPSSTELAFLYTANLILLPAALNLRGANLIG